MNEKCTKLMRSVVVIYKVFLNFSTNFKANVIGTENVMLLANKMKSLECYVHVSTAYCNCQHEVIQEALEPLIEDASSLLDKFKSLSGDQLEIEALKYFDGRPNNYVFTKAIAEHVVNLYRGNIPTVIARPAIVSPAYSEPADGFVDNLDGPLALSLVFGLGILQIIDWDFDHHVEFTPVDTLANSLPREMKIYNVTVSTLNQIPENYDLLKRGLGIYLKAPSIMMLRPPILPPLKSNVSPFEYKIKRFYYHTMFAYFIDLLLFVCGQKRIECNLLLFVTQIVVLQKQNEPNRG
ncbi:putative fatty acyl-CoA reductase-like protein [Leptotrombidium deliense]|uniref:Fatty acyl-CoA reductase n=1 Tax=Leptotrombidium deliense TaxID=299467 RepID=A0A443SNN2_9ACAR|nr:putative fatty acyl-CoA reductase-like protein [Leptotrombidium deliense]